MRKYKDAWFALLVGSIIAMSALLYCGCGTWQDTVHRTLDSIHETAKSVSSVVEPHFAEKCGKAAEGCNGKICDALVTCQGERRKVNGIIVSVHHGIIMGKLAAEAGDQPKAQTIVEKVIAAVAELNGILYQFGIKIL